MARREYQDAPLQKTKGDNPRWFIRVRERVVENNVVTRKQTRQYLGRCKEMTKAEALQARSAKLKEINGQVYSLPAHILLKDFAQIYLDKHVPTLGHGTQNKYQHLLKNHILPQFAKERLCDIRTEDIQAWLNEKAAQNYSWWSREDMRNVLSSIFTKAKEWKYWSKSEPNPVEDVTCGRKKFKREKRLLTMDQIELIRTELPAYLCLIIDIANSCTLRISEVLGLRWKNVNLETGCIIVEKRLYRGDMDVVKSDASARVMPLELLTPEIRDHYKRQGIPKPDAFVFCDSCGNPLDDRNLNQHFLRPAAKKHNVYFEGFGFHTFRRGAITGLQEEGASTIEVQKMAGHSRPSVTSDYTLISYDRKADLVRRRQNQMPWLNKRTAA